MFKAIPPTIPPKGPPIAVPITVPSANAPILSAALPISFIPVQILCFPFSSPCRNADIIFGNSNAISKTLPIKGIRLPRVLNGSLIFPQVFEKKLLSLSAFFVFCIHFLPSFIEAAFQSLAQLFGLKDLFQVCEHHSL